MKLVVGLGNPGAQYAGTRHNVGFEVVNRLLERGLGSWKFRFEAAVAEILVSDHRVLLAAPQTFMNLSGRAVRALTTFYKILPVDTLVVCDDLNLPTGKLRLRGSGSAGGQKGLQNIIDQLGTQDVPRLRLGIDRPAAGRDVSQYVLQKFSKSEQELMTAYYNQTADAVECWVRQGLEAAMNQYNSKGNAGSES